MIIECWSILGFVKDLETCEGYMIMDSCMYLVYGFLLFFLQIDFRFLDMAQQQINESYIYLNQRLYQDYYDDGETLV